MGQTRNAAAHLQPPIQGILTIPRRRRRLNPSAESDISKTLRLREQQFAKAQYEMFFRLRQLRKVSWISSRILTGTFYGKVRGEVAMSAATPVLLACAEANIGSKALLGELFSRRFSTVPQVSQASSRHVDLLSYVKSAVDELRGPSHYWLNQAEGNRNLFEKEGTYLLLAGQLLGGGSDQNYIFETVKLLQQRFPKICFMGIHSTNQPRIADDRTELTELIVKEYLTFPVLLTEKEFPETAGEVCYILFRDFKDPIIYHEKSPDITAVCKALEECLAQGNEKPKSINIFTNTWSKQADAIKESHSCAPLQDLLLYFPGCVSADKNGDRLFLSDSNHHRVIMFDRGGKILDSIGCCPGFEDGVFESAKLSRPAASFYDEEEDYLYIIDSENHAIRRADMERRVLETVYPNHCERGNSGLWSWITDKLGLGKDNETTPDVDARSDEFDSHSLIFPWHILKSQDNSFYIINRSFQKLWIMDLATGEIKEVVEGIPKVLEACQELMTDKLSALSHLPSDWLQLQTKAISSGKELPQDAFISSFTNLREDIIMADMVGQRVLKLNRESGACSSIQFSNLWILGLPYWLSIPLERVFAVANGVQEARHDHTQHFQLLPGKVNIRLNIELPTCTELVEPLHESCIWRQARGAATALSVVEDAKDSSEKVGASQQWYDELDSLAFETPDPETAEEEEREVEGDQDKHSDIEYEDKRVHIDSTVHTSPGTSEVIIYAALYLRLARNADSEGANQEELASRIADILNPEGNTEMSRDSFLKLLLKSKRDLRDLIFMKPMKVRIKLDSVDHPKADNSKDIILTDSSIEVDVSL